MEERNPPLIFFPFDVGLERSVNVFPARGDKLVFLAKLKLLKDKFFSGPFRRFQKDFAPLEFADKNFSQIPIFLL